MVKHRWRDTLFIRLALLLWGALIVSHLIAFGVVTQWILPKVRPELATGQVPRPQNPVVFPSLPPTPAISSPSSAPAAPHPPPLPWWVWLVDYVIRGVVMAGFAWWGARWLSLPMQRLSHAAQALGPTLAEGRLPQPLDEANGTIEVRETSRVFNRLATDLSSELRNRELLLAAVSHDLRTPLTRMRLHLEPLMNNPAAQRCISDIHLMDELVGNALDLVRYSTTAHPLQVTDVDALVQSVVDDLSEEPTHASLAPRLLLNEDPAAPAHLARAHPVLLRRAVANVLGNALRHANGGVVSVQHAQGVQQVLIVVDDHGPGMSAQDLELAFVPFFKAAPNPQPRHPAGYGLGLYIARDLLRRQGGDITLQNRITGGLSVQLRLPSAPAPTPQ